MNQALILVLVLSALADDVPPDVPTIFGLSLGSRVQRGPSWVYGNQDGGAQGTVIDFRVWRGSVEGNASVTAARVLWDASGTVNAYRWSKSEDGPRDLAIVGWRPLTDADTRTPRSDAVEREADAARLSAAPALAAALREAWRAWGSVRSVGWPPQGGGPCGVVAPAVRRAIADDTNEAEVDDDGTAQSGGRAPSKSWAGVACDADGVELIGVDLSRRGLNGSLSDGLRALPLSLVSLSLARNTLTGPLDNAVCAFSRLRFLDVTGNALSGPLPACLGDLINLEVVFIGNNDFEGSLPPSWARLHALKGLHLYGNSNLRGPVSKALRDTLATIKSLVLTPVVRDAVIQA